MSQNLNMNIPSQERLERIAVAAEAGWNDFDAIQAAGEGSIQDEDDQEQATQRSSAFLDQEEDFDDSVNLLTSASGSTAGGGAQCDSFRDATISHQGSHDSYATARQHTNDEDDDDDDEIFHQSHEDEADIENDEEEEPQTDTSTAEEQAELRRTVQELFELEEALLNQHMANIQENADMLTQEGKLLQMVQNGNVDEEEMDAYAVTLAEFLDRKECLLHKLQNKLSEFKLQLVKEQELASRVTRLSQY